MSGAFLLRPKVRGKIREVSRRALLDNPGDQDAAIRQATREIEQQLAGSIIVAILLGVAIQLAIELIVYWIKQAILKPAAEYQPDEPGGSDE